MKIDAPLNSQIPALRSLWQEAFGDTEEFLDTFQNTAFSTSRCRCITIDENVAAALYWFDCSYLNKRVAYIYAVATAKAYREQGLCHTLMMDTHSHLTTLGYEGVILVPGDKDLFKLYEGIGYRTCSYIRSFHCTGEAKEFPFHTIHKNEYARLRRQLLPKGGVIQENENLDFLQTQAQFYAGPDFLLAARGEGDTLYVIELLGNSSVATGIVHALGYTNGIIRTPGEDTAFAMYYPLRNNTLAAPTYFGFAFD